MRCLGYNHMLQIISSIVMKIQGSKLRVFNYIALKMPQSVNERCDNKKLNTNVPIFKFRSIVSFTAWQYYQGRIQDLIRGGAQIVTGLNCRRCVASVASLEKIEIIRSQEFMLSVGSGACLRALEALGYFITKYAFSPFWGTFLYYF